MTCTEFNNATFTKGMKVKVYGTRRLHSIVRVSFNVRCVIIVECGLEIEVFPPDIEKLIPRRKK